MGRGTILVANHDQEELRLTSDTLTGDGHRVFCAESAGVVLEAAHKLSPDVLLLDTLLPDLHEYDLCRRIRSSATLKDIKVVRIWPEVQSTECIAKGHSCEADGNLVRPLVPHPLRTTIQLMLRLKRAEEQLQHRDQFWRAIFAGMRDAVLVVDSDLKIAESNPRAAELFNYSVDELRATSLLQLCPETTHDTLVSRLALPSEDQAIVLQTEMLQKDHSTFPAELRVRRLCDDSNSCCEITIRNLDDELVSDCGSHMSARELDFWKDFPWQESTTVTAAMYAGGPISRLLPTYYEELLSSYSEILDLALEAKAYRVDHDLSGHLRQLAGRLGRLRAASRDVVELHTTVLKQKLVNTNPRKAQVYTVESRFLLVELLGYLATYYRDRAIGVPDNGSDQ